MPVVVLLVLCSVLSYASSPSLTRRRESSFPEPKRLSAGALSSKLKTRAEPDTVLRRKASFDYIADNVEDGRVFSTPLDVESQWPVLALEDMDAGLDSVSCTETELTLEFVSSAAEESFKISLEKVETNWHEAFSVTRVSFSHRPSSEILKRGPTQVKRPEAPSPTRSFPPGPSEPKLPVVVKCKTCTLQGDIQLSQGQFTLNEAIGFFTNSSIEFLVKRLFSQIELELELSSKGPRVELNAALPTIGLTPFQIAGVLTFGPLIVPQIIITADLKGDVGFSYGFNITVPDNSQVLIRIPNFDESEITGFGGTTLETIPIEAKKEISSMALNIAFPPQILLGINTGGINALNVDIDGGIGAFFSLPNLSLDVSKDTGVDEKCEAAAGTNYAIGNATRLIPSVQLDMGIIAVMIVAPVLASSAWDFPTACVGFDPEKATSRAGIASAADAEGDRDNGDGCVDSNGITRLWTLMLSTVAAGFCSWG
ncbi:hypothetical protein BDW67DRAFT_172589 [Aspergillus spinulosporus]